MPGDIPMPSQEETEKMFKELMKMQFEMNPDELDSDKEDKEEGKVDEAKKNETEPKAEAPKD